MGSLVTPNNVNLFMEKFKLDFIYNHNPYFKSIKYYWRYIDDLFFIWGGGANDLKEFHALMNSSKEFHTVF